MLKEGEKLLQKMERETKLNDPMPSVLVEEPLIQKKEIKSNQNSNKTQAREKIVKGKTKQRESKKTGNTSISFEKNSISIPRDRSLIELPSDRENVLQEDKRSVSLQDIDVKKLGFKAGQAAKLKSIIAQISKKDSQQSAKNLEAERITYQGGKGAQCNTTLPQIQEIPSPNHNRPNQSSREPSIEREDASIKRSEERAFELRRISGKIKKTEIKAQTMQDFDTSRSIASKRDPEESKEHKREDIFTQAISTKPSSKMPNNVQKKTTISAKTQKPRCSTLTDTQAPVQDKENPKGTVPLTGKSSNSETIKEKVTSPLTDEEKLSYGDRFPPGYKKISFLGRYRILIRHKTMIFSL